LGQLIADSFPLDQIADPNSQGCGEGLTILLDWRFGRQVNDGKSVSWCDILTNFNFLPLPNHNGASGNLSFRNRHIIVWVDDQSNSLKGKLHCRSPLYVLRLASRFWSASLTYPPHSP